jgi:phosphoglycolate phosphatase-like HAD superfamily hydrolase
MSNEAARWKVVAAVAVCLLVIVSGLYAYSAMSGNEGSGYKEVDLSLWTDGCDSKEALVSYLKAITDEKSDSFIPVEDRIAVFDMDGTLFCETDPFYFDVLLFEYRVLDDPVYKYKASDLEKEVAQMYRDGTDIVWDERVDIAMATCYKGMTMEELGDYVKEFKKMESPGFEGMTREEAFFKPMVQVFNALKSNGFAVYVVSGTERITVRAILDGSPIDVPNERIKGSDKLLVASGQDMDGYKYVLQDDDEITYYGQNVIKNLNLNKALLIAKEIGKKPVLAFGNSTSDSSMATYATVGNKYDSMAFFVCCDDLEREYGNMEDAERIYSLCEKNGWVPISMKNDWTTIYGDGVKKKVSA